MHTGSISRFVFAIAGLFAIPIAFLTVSFHGSGRRLPNLQKVCEPNSVNLKTKAMIGIFYPRRLAQPHPQPGIFSAQSAGAYDGITCTLLIALWVNDEVIGDRFQTYYQPYLQDHGQQELQ